jgi:hypothetical protein
MASHDRRGNQRGQGMKALSKKRGRPRKVKADKHGSKPNDEDVRGVTNVFRLFPHPKSNAGPVRKTENEFAPQHAIEKRLMTAMKTIRALPDKERAYLTMKGASIPYLREYIDAYNSSDVKVAVFIPRPKDISDCLVALSWVRHVDKKLWKIMWLRSFDLSFGLIARYIGRSDETARRWYREGITDAWVAANGIR